MFRCFIWGLALTTHQPTKRLPTNGFHVSTTLAETTKLLQQGLKTGLRYVRNLDSGRTRSILESRSVLLMFTNDWRALNEGPERQLTGCDPLRVDTGLARGSMDFKMKLLGW